MLNKHRSECPHMTEKRPRNTLAVGVGAISVLLLIGLIIVAYQTVSLNSQLLDITKVANLEKSFVWLDHQTVNQPARQSTEWSFSTDYAGYVTLVVQSSTTESTYVQLNYESHGVSYDSGRVSVGSSGTVSFPVLPGTITIRVGNTNLVNGATEIVTATLYY
jgi:hypothetical protein